MKRILITGANRGLGLALARQTAGRGDRVFASCRRPNEAAELQQLAAEFEGRVTVVALDVADTASVAAAHATVAAESDALDLLINNAGVLVGGETLDNFDPDVMARTLNTNTIGPMRVVKRFRPLITAGKAPLIMNVSSQLGSLQAMRPSWGRYSYNSSKAALNMLTRMLAFDLKGAGVTVVCVHPGWVRTDMGGQAAAVAPEDSAAGLLRLAGRLSLAETGRFYTYTGDEHLW